MAGSDEATAWVEEEEEEEEEEDEDEDGAPVDADKEDDAAGAAAAAAGTAVDDVEVTPAACTVAGRTAMAARLSSSCFTPM
jgi:hypothetical protein